jgi:nucleoside-diphosphate-sugar epimerase
MSSKKVFVFTATGDQGKAVALKLNAAGWQVTGLTRNTGSASAKGECSDQCSPFSVQKTG